MGEKVSYCADMNCLDDITAKRIAECADKGYEDAKVIFAICGEMLGRGLAVLVKILDPEKIVLGSIFQRCEHLLREPMEKVLEKECLTPSRKACRIVPALFKENIGDYAALAVAMMGKK